MKILNAARKDFSRTILKAAAATLGLAVCATVSIRTARADCGSYTIPSQKLMSAPTQRPVLKPVAFRLATLAPAAREDDKDRDHDAAIVGMWKVQFMSEGTTGIPDDTVVESGYAQWHSDGTEIMNSGLRPPATSNFCLGVWKQTGRSTYKLNHFALSWDTSNTFVGPANIREEVTLDDQGNSFSGTFTIDQFDTNGNTLAHILGKITAQRVTPD